MTFDLSAKTPTGQAPATFHRSNWGWRGLADLILAECQEEAAPCRYWHSNGGDGLDGHQAHALGARLIRLVRNGTVQDLIAMRDAALAALPDERCRFCNGSGIRDDRVAVYLGFPQMVCAAVHPDTGAPHPRAGQRGYCNACHGVGAVRPVATSYPLSVADVSEFALFALFSGGFEIW